MQLRHIGGNFTGEAAPEGFVQPLFEALLGPAPFNDKSLVERRVVMDPHESAASTGSKPTRKSAQSVQRSDD